MSTTSVCHFRKRKAEDEPDTAVKKVKSEAEETMRKQNKTMFRHRDELSGLNKKHLSLILEDNDQYIPKGESRVSKTELPSKLFITISIPAHKK